MTVGPVAETTSTLPPSNATMESPEERNGTTVSLSTATPATLRGLAMAKWVVRPRTGATAKLTDAASRCKRASKSCTLRSGLSARTATSELSSTIMATGTNSRMSALSMPVACPAMLPVWKVPRWWALPRLRCNCCKLSKPAAPGLFSANTVWPCTRCCDSSICLMPRAYKSTEPPGATPMT